MSRLLLIALLVGAVLVPAGYSASNPLRVFFVGDSLTAGALADRGPYAFHYVVTNGLARGGRAVTEVRDAKGGVKTAYWKPAAIPSAVDIAIVELGTNDVPWTSAEQFTADYSHLIETIKAKSPNARFVCLSVWRPKDTAATVAPYDATIRSLCPGRYVNIGRFAHPPNLGKDGFHPNNAGHALIGRAILAALR